MVVKVPGEVRHYWRGARTPLLNLSDLDPEALGQVLNGLRLEGRQGSHHRRFGTRYMDLRRRTEEKMRRLFIEAGGCPARLAPHYFVLGESRWFRGLADDMQVLVLPLEDLPVQATSFTYPDSFTAMGLVPEYGLPYERRPYHEQVFLLHELDEVISEYGLPEDIEGGYEGYVQRPFEQYIEVQLWSDEPVARWLPVALGPG